MKRLIAIFSIIALAAVAAVAQTMSVAGFEERPMDMDARVTHPVTDPNGQTCALIKVETTQTGFGFDTGVIQVVKTEQKIGEVWVYVQPRVKKITIMHQDYEPVRDYYFPTGALKEATVYLLKLRTAGAPVQAASTQQRSGFLIIDSEPQGAEVWLNNESTGEVTPFRRKLAIGDEVPYRLSLPLYHDEAGMVTVDQPRKELQFALRPAFGSVTVTSTPSGALVFLDEKQVGQTPLTLDHIASGSHSLRFQAPQYAVERRNVSVADGQTANVAVTLAARFAEITVQAPQGAVVTVDGDRKGSGTLSWRQSEGLCDIVVSMAGHRDARRQLEVVAGRAQTVQLTPQPIYGSASVDSDLMDAEIWIDGKQYGVTPNVVERLLVGSHTLVLKKSGYADLQQQFSVEEGKEASLLVKLPAGRSVQFTSEKPGMQIIVDGKKLGTTPLTAVVGIGHHSVSAMRGGDIIDVRDLDITSAGAPLTMAFRDFNHTFTVNGVQFTMVEVGGGTFTMGATSEQGSDAWDEEKPAHEVTLSDYYIGQTEVTQALWEAVMGSNPSDSKGDNLPVERVSWDDCQVFIQKLNQLTGKQFRLPTEAEWEYAARGGRKSRGYKYAGGNNIDSVAWCDGNSGNETHPVATKQANELGIYDMSGNVLEWCSDWCGDYTSSSQSDPQGSSSGSFRVIRGGCYYNFARNCRVSYRISNTLDYRSGYLGLRLSCNR
uniref:PEGA domain-containing protein n=1 Tax=Candidatus Limisoma sp. TaxID=3076476 RepID=UPI003FF0AD20